MSACVHHAVTLVQSCVVSAPSSNQMSSLRNSHLCMPQLLEDNEVDLRCAFEEIEDEDERQDEMGEDLGAEKRAPKLHAFGA